MTHKQARAQYPQEFNVEAVSGHTGAIPRQVRAGQAIAVVAKVLGIPKASLGNWVRQSAKGDLSGAGTDDRAAKVSPEQMELARLRVENARLRMERDIAKNVHRGAAPSQWPETRVCVYTEAAGLWPSAFWKLSSPSKNVAHGELADPAVVAPRATPIRTLIYSAPLPGVLPT